MAQVRGNPRGRGGGGGGGGGGGRRGGGRGGGNTINAPRTIRQMLLWLYWLGKGTHNTAQAGSEVVHYKTKLENYIDGKLNTELVAKYARANANIPSVTHSAKSLVETVCKDAGKILVTIQQGVQYNSGTHQSELEKLNGESQNFEYPDGKDLFDCFGYYVTACYWQLEFLYTACGVESTNGGWKACQYGQAAPEISDQCNDTKTSQKNHDKRCPQCSNNSGCLMTFLTATRWDDTKTSKTNIYNGAEYNGDCTDQNSRRAQGASKCRIQPMGFDQQKLPGPLKGGKDLHSHLNSYINGKDKNFPKLLGYLKLLQLLEASTSTQGSTSPLTAPKSWIAGDLWAFWYQLNKFWNGNNKTPYTGFKDKLNNKIKEQYDKGFIKKEKQNTNPTNADYANLNDVFTKLLFAAHSSSSPQHSSLLSLSDCEGNRNNSSNTCGKYLYSLLSDPFHHVLQWFKNNIGRLTFPMLQALAKKLKEKLDELKKGLEQNNKQCVTEQSSSCKCIVYCDETHAFLYRNGFTFQSPMSLAVMKNSGSSAVQDTTRKGKGAKERKCSDLKDQLEIVTKEGSELDEFTKLERFNKPPEPQAPKPAAAKPVAAKPTPATPPRAVSGGASKAPQARAEDTQNSSSSSVPTPPPPPAPAAAARPVAAKPEAPKPQGAKPAATKPATSNPAVPAPAPAAPPSSSGSGAGGGNSGDSSATPGSGTKGGDTGTGSSVPGSAPGVAPSTSGPPPAAPAPAGPPPPPPPGPPAPAAAKQASTPPATSSGPGGGQGRSASPTGTVHNTHFHKDGVALWSIFKHSFDGVLDQFKKVVSSVSRIADRTSSLILKEINAHHSSLLEPPCNIKECLEWLDRVCTNGNKDCQCQKRQHGNSCNNCMALNLYDAVNAILPGLKDTKVSGKNNTVLSVVREASALFNATKGPNYQPAYKLSAQWPTCGTAIGGTNSGVQCSCCQKNNSCKCTASSSSSPCDGTCCHRCEVRVCAGIFIAMVPALDRALRELRDKLQKGNNGTKNISDTPVQGYLQHLGYEENDLSDTKWSQVQSKLQMPVQHLGKIKDKINNAFLGKKPRGKNNSTPPCYFQAAENSTTKGESASSQCAASCATVTCSTPRTVREMLLWLMGLPYCKGYKQFVEKLKGNSCPLLNIAKKNNNDHYIHRQYSAVIFQLPVLFFTVEADVSYLRDTFCQFAPEHNRERLKNVSQDKNQYYNNNIRSFQYPCDGDSLCAMFYDYSYKVHLQLRFLLTMCDTDRSDGGWKQCKYAAPAATSSDGTGAVSKSSIATPGAQECCSKHNLLCSCTTQRSRSTTVSNSCRQLLREFLRDCQNKDPKNCTADSRNCTTHSLANNPVTRNIFQAPCSQLHVRMGFRVPECDHNKKDCCTLICHYTGDNIKAVLSGLVDESKGPSRTNNYNGSLSKPLSVVTQWMTALQGQEPRSLGDILDLFRELCVGSNRTKNSASALEIGVRNGTDRNVTMASVLLEQLGALLKDKYLNYLSKTGIVSGADTAEKHVKEIQGAVHALLDVQHHRSTTGRQSQDSDPNLYSLVSIMLGCNTVRSGTCTPYIKSLSYGLYKYYVPEFNTQANGGTKNSSDHVLDWLFKWLTALYKGLKELKKRIGERCDCCLEGGKKKHSSQCTSIVSCCQCPPELYRCGLVLGDPKTLNGSGRQRTPKKCTDFIDSVSAVLSTYAPLFKACEAIMNTVYHVLLMASRNRVYTHIVKLETIQKDGLSAAQKELIVAFHRYVDRAMQCSKKKLMETFLQPLSEDYNCQGCDDKCHKKDVEVSVSASSVTTITAVIPQYTAPVIDPYHYRAMTKIECCEDCKGKKYTEGNNSVSTQGNVLPACYTFRSALDFHVRGTNCILPVPSDLRSAVDWLLRITVGNTNGNNDNIKQLSEEIKSVFKECGVTGTTDTEVQQHVTALVDGLRKFMGYQDRSDDVKEEVSEKKDSVQEQLKERIDKIQEYLKKNDKFAQELGIALQKAMFTVAKNGAKSDKKSLKCVVAELQEKLTEKHNGNCELKCNEFNKNTVDPKSSASVQADGLKLLECFCKALEQFSNDGEKYRNAYVICTVIPSAKSRIEQHNSTNDKLASGFFDKLFTVLSKLGQCQRYITPFSPTGSGMTSSRVKNKLDMLINNLQRATENLNDDDVKRISSACDIYMRVIHKESQCFIVNSIKQNIELECYEKQNGTLVIRTLLTKMHTVVSSRMDAFKSHLDDLKQLCQWLYRMGQLYAHGLKGFVESLAKHLQHILQVIKWIEKLKVFMNIVMNSNDAQSNEVKESMTAGTSTIAKLLSSYVLSTPSDVSISDDNASTYRTFLLDLRLLALDRYTLQVWQDNKNHIRDWITFEGGIIRHSNLGEIKSRLSDLTRIAYSSNTASASHRIHDFHAICVLQKFSYEAPITQLEKSLKELKGIKEKLSAVKQKCESQTDVSSDTEIIQPFCTAVSQFLAEKYGIYNLAKFVHTIMGPNIFSAVIGALEELRDPNKYQKNNGSNGNLDKIKGILGVMTEGLDGENNKDHYKLEEIITKLEAFITTLKKEYIFSYPVDCGIELEEDCKAVCPGECDKECDRKLKDASLACSVQPKEKHCSMASVTPSHTSASSTLSLTSPMPLLCVHCHMTDSICPCCVPLLARMFITLVPVLYPQLCYLAYQCRLYWCARPVRLLSIDKSNKKELSSLLQTFGYDNDILQVSSSGLYFIGDNVWSLLCKETNSLQLLCHDISEPSNVFPFNTESPLYRLYTQCLSYYQRRKNERLTQSKSTPPVTPTTVRQILRFFVYLPFSAQFQSLQEVLRSYCSQSGSVHYSDIFTTMMMSSAMGAVLLQLIECPQGTFLCFFDDIYTNKEGLYLGSNTETLLYQLCDLSVTLYRSLKFLSLQCGTERSFAGWKDCRLRGEKGNKECDDTQASDTQQLQLRASHLCECIGAKDSSTTCSVLTTAARMCLTAGSSVSTQPSHTTSCSFPLLRYMTDDCFFGVSATIPSALRKVCLNDSCQEMLYRHMAPRGWQKEALQCTHRECQQGDCDQKTCCSVCHLKDSDPNCCDPLDSKCCCHPCPAQCCAPVCSTLYGHELFHVLRNFVGHEHDADPLLQFTRYMVSIAAWPPDSLSGYMTFMLRFGDQLRKEKRDSLGSVSVSSLAHRNTSQKKDWNSSVLSGLRSEIALFPGEFDHKCLIDAFLNVTCCEHNNGVASSSSAASLPSSTTDASSSPLCPTSSGVTIPMLRDCKDCNYYNCIIYPLDSEIYDLYLPMYARRYLTWMLHFGPRLHRGMRALEKGFKRHIEENGSQSGQSGACSTDHSVTQSGTSDSRTSVQSHASMLQCPFALPELHSAGLHFWDPEKMCTVSCQCLLQRLRCTLQDSSPLAEFLSACDRFLWSVRKPFYWLTMTLWIVATVYLLFVHLWRLDSWRLLSHAIRSRASHVVYPKVLLAAEQSYKQYYAQR